MTPPDDYDEAMQQRVAAILSAAPKPTGEVSSLVAMPFDAVSFDLAPPPPRDWAYTRLLLYRTVGVAVGPPGANKTTYMVQLAVAFSLGLPFGDFQPRRTGNVWFLSAEDDRDELTRRVRAACVLMDVDPAALPGRLFLNHDADHRIVIAREDRGGLVTATPDVKTIVKVIRRREIRLLIVDPFAEFAELSDENSNPAVRAVTASFRDIAQQTDCCVFLTAHSPKAANADNAAGDLSAIRGGGAIGGVVRSALTMFEMSKKDAEALGVDEVHRNLFVRVDQAKITGAAKASEPWWFRRESVGLGNGVGLRPEDLIGVLAPYRFSRAERQRDVKEQDDARIDVLCQEIVRVCAANRHTSAETAAALDVICNAVDPKRLGVGPRTARSLVIGELAPARVWGGFRIVISNIPHGTQTLRRVHVEPVEDDE